jgi:hypothetical protein
MYSALFRVKTTVGTDGRVVVYAGKSLRAKCRVTVQAIVDAVDSEQPLYLEGIKQHKYPKIEPDAYRVRLFHPNRGAWIPKHRIHDLRANRMLASRLQNAAGCYWAVEILDAKNNIVLYRKRGEKQWRTDNPELAAKGL